jgi:hypothetical protein
MTVHFIPLLLAKVAGKLLLKKAAAHHGAHHAFGRKIVKEGAKEVLRRAAYRSSKSDDKNSRQDR